MKPIIITNDFVGPTFSEEEYLNQTQTWLYLWRLQGLDLPLKHDPIKLGIAKAIYKANFEAGWAARIRDCLRAIQREYDRDDLTAKVLALRLSANEAICDSERFVHFGVEKNFANKVNQNLSGQTLKLWTRVAGQSEFYVASEASMRGRFYNSLRKTNQQKGAGVLAKWREQQHINERRRAKKYA